MTILAFVFFGGVVGTALFFLDEIRRTLGRIEKLLEKQRDRD